MAQVWRHSNPPACYYNFKSNFEYISNNRHNIFAEQVKKAAVGGWELVSENQSIVVSFLKQDLEFVKDNLYLIIDVTVTLEYCINAFEATHREKIAKYANIVEKLQEK